MNRALTCLFASALLLACSSKNSSPAPATTPPAETGTVPEDTAPPEDAAPWLTYPDGPYGITKGAVFPNITWQGYKQAKGDWVDISMIDYYDPDGSRGINAIYVVVSAEWCVPCQHEAVELPRLYAKYKPRGAAFISGMLQRSNGKPADEATVDRWIAAYKIDFDIVAAPCADLTKCELVPPSWAIPRNYVINPRDMTIYSVITASLAEGAPTLPGVNVMLKLNGSPDPGPGDAGVVDTGAADTGSSSDIGGSDTGTSSTDVAPAD